MTTSCFELFKIGIGPSSSHTVGPMLAAWRFGQLLEAEALLDDLTRIQIDVYGSLAMTGHGHATDIALCMGLMGERPDQIDPDQIAPKMDLMREQQQVDCFARKQIRFVEADDLRFHFGTFLPAHPNAVTFTAFDQTGQQCAAKTYYSIGGGFVLSEDEIGQSEQDSGTNRHMPFDFSSAAELMEICTTHNRSIADVMLANECSLADEAQVLAGLDAIDDAMMQSIDRGLKMEGLLPGGLKIRRRAGQLVQKLKAQGDTSPDAHLQALDWVNAFALAVNEENAAGGRVVTAPTNGAAGVIPAVLAYYRRFCAGSSQEGVRIFLLTATAIGSLYKQNASISAAEVGCQGEVGVACSMAAAGLAAVMGGTVHQIENAAEIGMEHNLGLTCDPIQGLVQIPCIERNTMGAVKAINAARLAIYGDGQHTVPLDQVIKTMLETGRDMQSKYKETSVGGLAVNVVSC